MRLRNILLCALLIFSHALYAKPVELALADINGVERKLSDYRGQWIVVNYWATWCLPCVEEMPALDAFDRHHDNTFVIGVNYEHTEVATVRKFLQEHKVNYPIWLASTDVPSPLGKVQALPTTFIVSPNGEVVHKKVGRIDIRELEGLLKKFQHP